MRIHTSYILIFVLVVFTAANAQYYRPWMDNLYAPAADGGLDLIRQGRTDVNTGFSGTGKITQDGFAGEYIEIIEVDSVDDIPAPASGRAVLFKLSSADSLYWILSNGMIAAVAESTTLAATADAWSSDAPVLGIFDGTTYYRLSTEWVT